MEPKLSKMGVPFDAWRLYDALTHCFDGFQQSHSDPHNGGDSGDHKVLPNMRPRHFFYLYKKTKSGTTRMTQLFKLGSKFDYFFIISNSSKNNPLILEFHENALNYWKLLKFPLISWETRFLRPGLKTPPMHKVFTRYFTEFSGKCLNFSEFPKI